MYFTFITVRENKLKIEVGWRKIKQSKKFPAPPPHGLYFFCITSPIFRYISEPPPPPPTFTFPAT